LSGATADCHASRISTISNYVVRLQFFLAAGIRLAVLMIESSCEKLQNSI
jgi:hypothetical protein